MKRTAIALILAALATSGAYALGLGRQGVGMGKLGASSKAGSAAIIPTGSALLVDGTDAALLVDGTDPACLVGGC